MRLFRNLARRAAPPPDLTVSQWADNFRKLSPESSAEPGQWHTDRAPYQRAIMDAVNDPTVEQVVVMSSAQVGKTAIIENILGYHVAYDPAPIMLVMPTLEMAQMFSKDRLAPMLRDTPVLHGLVRDAKSRDSGNTMLHKSFPGGHITMVGANSPAGLSSRPIRILLCDEVDRYPISAGTEGDPVTLAIKRTTTFWNRKVVLVSTPTVKGESRIETAYERSTKERWCLPCPSCGELQPLTWGMLDFQTLSVTCRACGVMHAELEWKSGAGQWVAEHPGRKIRGFHLNELVSPWKPWTAIIEDFLAAKDGGTEMLRAWINTSLGETWEEEGDAPTDELLEQRRHYYQADLPAGAVVLTCGIDVQQQRLEYEVVGWGVGKTSYGIEYGIITGDPAQPAVWEQLDSFLQRTWARADGASLGISCTCVDSGYSTTEVYAFCHPREHRRVFAIKGHGGAGIPLVGKYTRVGRHKTALFNLGVDTGKELIFSRLKVAHESEPGYCHFPREQAFDDGRPRGYDAEYFRGLTSEKRVLRYRYGRPYHDWVRKRGVRNEPLDLRNYATAALEILNPQLAQLAAQPRRVHAMQQHTPITGAPHEAKQRFTKVRQVSSGFKV